MGPSPVFNQYVPTVAETFTFLQSPPPSQHNVAMLGLQPPYSRGGAPCSRGPRKPCSPPALPAQAASLDVRLGTRSPDTWLWARGKLAPLGTERCAVTRTEGRTARAQPGVGGDGRTESRTGSPLGAEGAPQAHFMPPSQHCRGASAGHFTGSLTPEGYMWVKTH